MNYYVAKRAGRPILNKVIGKVWTLRLEKWFQRWGSTSVVFTRAVPVLPSDAITYVAGVAGMNVATFLPASFVGVFIRSIILVMLGQLVMNLLPIKL